MGKKKGRKKSQLNALTRAAGGAPALGGAVEAIADIHAADIAAETISAAEAHAKILKKGRDAALQMI